MTQRQTAFTETWELSPTDGIFFQDRDWIFLSETPIGKRIALYGDRKTEIEITHEDFEKLRDERKLTIRRFKYLHAAPQIEFVRSTEPSLSDLNATDKRKLFFRVDVCDHILAGLRSGTLALSEAKLEPALRSFWSSWLIEDFQRNTADGRHGAKAAPPIITCPSVTTAKRWLRIYRACNCHPISLVNGYGKSGNRNCKVSKYAREVIDRHARTYISRLQPTKAAVYRALVGEIESKNNRRLADWQARPGSKKPVLETVPCIETLYRAIRKLNQFEVLAGRIGEDAAARRLALHNGGMGELRLMERVEMDDWEVPLQVLLENAGIWASLPKKAQKLVERTKVKALTAIECASRICLAAKLVLIPTAAAAVETLNLASNDKTMLAQMAGCKMPWNQRGFAFTYATDNGVYKEPLFRAALADVRVIHHLMPSRKPGARGKKERYYRRLVDQLIAWFSGQTFQNPIVRGDYDSEGNAVIDMEELGRILIRFIVDVYHLTAHEGLGGRAPLDVWNEKRSIYRVLPPLNSDQNRHVFGVMAKRQIGNHGIRLLGLNYQSAALQRLRALPTLYQRKLPGGRIERLATIRVDPLNLGAISVRTTDGWITVPCQIAGFENVPLLQWQLACQKIRGDNLEQTKVYQEVVLEALRAIQDFADKAIIRANIASPLLSQKAFDHFERTIFAGFAVATHDNCDADPLDFAPDDVALPDRHTSSIDDTSSDGDIDPLFGFEG